MPARQERRMCPRHQNPRDARSGHDGRCHGRPEPRQLLGALPAPTPSRNVNLPQPRPRSTRLALGWSAALLAGVIQLGASWNARAAEGLALVIVYDTSGSMREMVTTATGKKSPKYIIGNRALEQIIARIDHYATNSPVVRTVHAGLCIFDGREPRAAVPFGPFQSARMLDWIKNYPGPNSGTPLGSAIQAASRPLLASKLSQKHILVITDGQNTIGPDPIAIVPNVQKSAEKGGTPIYVHFVAFDIDAKVFSPLKKLGVTVVGAADETQLNQQLEFILEEKILLEKETPNKP